MRVLLDAEGDENGDVWIDAVAPQVQEEEAAPFRVVIRAGALGAGDAPATTWLRVARADAYRLFDELGEALGRGQDQGAPQIIKKTKLTAPLKGGVDRETGEMILVFQGQGGLQHRMALPYDQSGATLEILERAAKSAATWHDDRMAEPVDGVHPIDLRPRETEYVMLAQDPSSGRPLLVARLVGGQQFSFLLDQKIVEQLRNPPREAAAVERTSDPWLTVAEDIEWLQQQWCTLYEPPSDADLRRGSATLRRLLVNGLLGQAWRRFGFERQPKVIGPDVLALLARDNTELRHVVGLVAGGATIRGIQTSMIGAKRVDNPTTGVSADADEGFAVAVFHISRDARGAKGESDLTPLTEREWYLSKYLDAPGAIRLGQTISHLDIVKYFANVAGGVHLDAVESSGEDDQWALVRDLQHKVKADVMEGLYFALLSIGQALGRSADLQTLAAKIRA